MCKSLQDTFPEIELQHQIFKFTTSKKSACFGEFYCSSLHKKVRVVETYDFCTFLRNSFNNNILERFLEVYYWNYFHVELIQLS